MWVWENPKHFDVATSSTHPTPSHSRLQFCLGRTQQLDRSYTYLAVPLWCYCCTESQWSQGCSCTQSCLVSWCTSLHWGTASNDTSSCQSHNFYPGREKSRSCTENCSSVSNEYWIACVSWAVLIICPFLDFSGNFESSHLNCSYIHHKFSTLHIIISTTP